MSGNEYENANFIRVAGEIYTFTTLPLPSDLRGQVESFWQ